MRSHSSSGILLHSAVSLRWLHPGFQRVSQGGGSGTYDLNTLITLDLKVRFDAAYSVCRI